MTKVWFREDELAGLGFMPGDDYHLRRDGWTARMRENRDGTWEFHLDLLENQAKTWGYELALPPKSHQPDSSVSWGPCWTGLSIAAGLALWWATTRQASPSTVNGTGVLAILASILLTIALVAVWFTVPSWLFASADRQGAGVSAAWLQRGLAWVVWIVGIAAAGTVVLGVVRNFLSLVAPFVALALCVIGVLVLAVWVVQARLSHPRAQSATRAAAAAASDASVLTPEPDRADGIMGFFQDVLAPAEEPSFASGSAMAALTTTYDGVRGTAAAIAALAESKGWGRFASGRFVPAFELVGIRPVGADGDAQLLFDPLLPGVTAGDLQGYVPALLTELHVRRAIGEVARDHQTRGMSLTVTNRPTEDDAPPAPRTPDDSGLDEWIDDL